MKTLLTGANGLVGSTLDADVKVCGRDEVDLRNWEQTYDLFKKEQPTHVIHTAARVGGLQANLSNMGEFFYDNMMMNLNVLEAARRTDVKKVVSFLSTCVFPAKVEYPLTEDKLHDGEPHFSNYGYAYAKRMLDVQARAYNDQYGVSRSERGLMSFGGKYISVIPTNIYGPNDNFELGNSHVVPALIHKCYLAKQQKLDFMVWGSGLPLREFIYADDVGDLTQLILESYEDADPLILSSSEEVSIRDLVQVIVEAMDYEGKVFFDGSKPDGQYRKSTSNSKLQSFVPGYRFTSLKKGIEQTVKWFIKNYETCRK